MRFRQRSGWKTGERLEGKRAPRNQRRPVPIGTRADFFGLVWRRGRNPTPPRLRPH
jgi:hypothetical protein